MKRPKDKIVYESIDILSQEMAKFAVKNNKNKLIEEIEDDINKSKKGKKIKHNDNDIINFSSDTTEKRELFNSSENFSSKENSSNSLYSKSSYKSKYSMKVKSNKSINSYHNKQKNIENSNKNTKNKDDVRNTDSNKIRSYFENICNKKSKKVSFAVDKKTDNNDEGETNKLNKSKDIIKEEKNENEKDKENESNNNNEINNSSTIIKGDLEITYTPIKDKKKDDNFYEIKEYMDENKINENEVIVKTRSNKNLSDLCDYVDSLNDNSKLILRSSFKRFNGVKSNDNKKRFKPFHLNEEIKNEINLSRKAETRIVLPKIKYRQKNSEKSQDKKKYINLDNSEDLIKYINDDEDISSSNKEESYIKKEEKNNKEENNNNNNSKRNTISTYIVNTVNETPSISSSGNKNGQNNSLILKYYVKGKNVKYKNFLEKQLKRKRFTEIKINKKRREKELKELENNYFTPKINSLSLQIVNSKGNYMPLFKRAIELENEKKMRILINQKKQNNLFVMNNSNRTKRTPRQINDFFYAQMDWKDKIEKKNNKLKELLNEKDTINDLEIINYEMKIDPNSELIIQKKRQKINLSKNNISYTDRLNKRPINNSANRLYRDYEIRQKKLIKLKKELTPSFKPNINISPLPFYSSSSRRIKRNYYNKRRDEVNKDYSYNYKNHKDNWRTSSRNNSPFIIKSKRSRNTKGNINNIPINHISSRQLNKKDNNLKSTGVDSKNTKSFKHTTDINSNAKLQKIKEKI